MGRVLESKCDSLCCVAHSVDLEIQIAALGERWLVLAGGGCG